MSLVRAGTMGIIGELRTSSAKIARRQLRGVASRSMSTSSEKHSRPAVGTKQQDEAERDMLMAYEK